MKLTRSAARLFNVTLKVSARSERRNASCDGGAKARRGSFCFTTADANANEIIAEFRRMSPDNRVMSF